MNYEIDLDKVCFSIESNINLETDLYIDEERSLELKMTRAEFNSKKEDLKKSLGLLYDGITSSLKKSIPEISDKLIQKTKERKMNLTKQDAEKKIQKAFIFVEKQQFINNLINFISIKDNKSFRKDKYKRQQKGVAIVKLDNKVLAEIFNSVNARHSKVTWITFLVNLTIQILNLFLVRNAQVSSFISDASYIGANAVNYGHYKSLQQVKATDKMRKIAKKTYRKSDFEFKKYFKVMWDFDQAWQYNKTYRFETGVQMSNLIVVPKFKIKPSKK